MKFSRLAYPANPCGASRRRADAAVAHSGITRLPTDRAAWRSVAVAAFFCLMALAASAFALELAWNRNPEPDVTGYELSYGTATGKYTTTVATGITPSAIVTGLLPGTRYYFVVRAVNASGLKSAASQELVHLTAAATPVNAAPVAASSTVASSEDMPVPLSLSASDADGDPLTYQIISGPAKGTLSGAAPHLTYTPRADINGSDTFTFLASDGKATSNTATVSISISAVNDAPIASASSVATSEDKPVSLSLSATDADGDPLTYQIISGPAKGTLSGSAPHLTYTPRADINGSDTFTFLASDGKATSNTATVSISISAVNDAPVASASSVATPLDTPVAIKLTASDKDGDPLTYQIISGPSSGSLSGKAPALAYTPVAGFIGTDTFAFQTTDGSLSSSTATVTISVTANPNGPRVIARTGWALVSVDSEENPGNPATAAFDGNPSTFWHTRWKTAGTPPPHEIVINLSTAHHIQGFRYLPRQDGYQIGNISGYEFHTSLDGTNWSTATSGSFGNTNTVQQVGFPPRNARYIRLRALGDASGSIHTAVAELDLLGGAVVNQAPVASDANVETRVDIPAELILVASDADQDTLFYQIVAGPASGSLSGTAPHLVYTPAPGFTGDDTLTFRVHDGITSSAQATVSIRVASGSSGNSNQPPIFLANPLAPPPGQESRPYVGGSIATSATDPDGDGPLTFVKLAGPAWLEVSSPGLLTGTPPSGSAGRHEFVIRVSDPAGASAEAALVIEVEPARLPLPWDAVEIGAVTGRTLIAHSNNVFRLKSPGRLAGMSDAGAFACQTLSGDGSIIARIGPVDNGGANSRIGLMIRDSLAPGSRHVFIGLSGKGDYRWVRRLGGDESRAKHCGEGKPMRTWVKLERTGSTITAFTSEDGRRWTKAGATAANFGEHCHIGLYVSGGMGREVSAAFQEVRIQP